MVGKQTRDFGCEGSDQNSKYYGKCGAQNALNRSRVNTTRPKQQVYSGGEGRKARRTLTSPGKPPGPVLAVVNYGWQDSNFCASPSFANESPIPRGPSRTVQK